MLPLGSCHIGSISGDVAQKGAILEEPPGSHEEAGPLLASGPASCAAGSQESEVEGRGPGGRREGNPFRYRGRTVSTEYGCGRVPGKQSSLDLVRGPRRITQRPDGEQHLPQRSFSFRERSDSLGGATSLHPQASNHPTHAHAHHLSMDLELPGSTLRQNLTVNHSFPDLYDMAGREKLPRTLSTSALRIKTRSSFWEKFWQCHQEARLGSKL